MAADCFQSEKTFAGLRRQDAILCCVAQPSIGGATGIVGCAFQMRALGYKSIFTRRESNPAKRRAGPIVLVTDAVDPSARIASITFERTEPFEFIFTIVTVTGATRKPGLCLEGVFREKPPTTAAKKIIAGDDEAKYPYITAVIVRKGISL